MSISLFWPICLDPSFTFGVVMSICTLTCTLLEGDGLHLFNIMLPIGFIFIFKYRWNTYVVDGHSVEELCKAFWQAQQVQGKPTCIVAKTFKGKGLKSEWSVWYLITGKKKETPEYPILCLKILKILTTGMESPSPRTGLRTFWKTWKLRSKSPTKLCALNCLKRMLHLQTSASYPCPHLQHTRREIRYTCLKKLGGLII